MDDDLFFEYPIDDFTTICISTLSSKSLEALTDSTIGGKPGYYICKVDERPTVGGLEVLAKAASFEAACDLWETLQRAFASVGPSEPVPA